MNMQPLYKDSDGIIRFQQNAIVRELLDKSQALGFGLNNLADGEFTQADWEQFYQLIGYSLSGYHELSQVSDKSAREATAEARKLSSDAGGCRDGADPCEIHSGVVNELEAKAAKPPAETWCLVDTDNFGGDYSDERLLAVGISHEPYAHKMADAINQHWGPHALRYCKVEKGGYVLAPGFEP